MEALLDLPASHLQCLVSSFGAGQLYDFSSTRTILWPYNCSTTRAALADCIDPSAIERLAQRGCAVVHNGLEDDEHRLHTLADPTGVGRFTQYSFDFKHDLDADWTYKHLKDAAQRALGSTTWVEESDRTRLLDDTEFSEDFSDARVDLERTCYEDKSPEMIMYDKAVLLEHSDCQSHIAMQLL